MESLKGMETIRFSAFSSGIVNLVALRIPFVGSLVSVDSLAVLSWSGSSLCMISIEKDIKSNPYPPGSSSSWSLILASLAMSTCVGAESWTATTPSYYL